MSAPPSTPTQRHLLRRNRAYLTWLVSDTATGLGSALASFAIPLLALFLTDDPLQAGVIGGVSLVARLIVTVLGGVLADRHDRIRLLAIGSLAGLGLAAAFTVLALLGALDFWTLLALSVLLSVRAGLFSPAGEAALKRLVPADAMASAQAANQGRDAVLSLAGGPLGGVLLAAGAWLVGLAMTASNAVGAVMAVMLSLRTRPRPSTPSDRTAIDTHRERVPPAARLGAAAHEAFEGFRWLLARRDLRGVMLVSTLVNLGFNAAFTTIVYGLQQDGHPATVIGLIEGAIGTTLLVGSFIAPVAARRLRGGIITLAALVLCTLAVFALTVIDDPVGISCTLAAGMVALPSLNAAALGYFVVATPSELLGRANSAMQVIATGAMPLAPLVAGFGLTAFGRTATILVCAALCAVAAAAAFTIRALRALPASAGWEDYARRFTGRTDQTGPATS